jgi:uncharacterized protein (DUF2267 family)
MSATGLEVFDKTLQTTNLWLDEIMADIGPDRRTAWHVLSVVLRTVRDRVPLGLAAHLGAQLPLIVRGAYYDQWSPSADLLKIRNQDEFLAHVQDQLRDMRPVNPRNAVIAVFNVLSRHVPQGQCTKVREALPEGVRSLWQMDGAGEQPAHERAAAGRAAQNAQEARVYQQRPEGQRKPA